MLGGICGAIGTADMMTEAVRRKQLGGLYCTDDVFVTREAIGMRQKAIGWINTGFLSIGLLCDPSLVVRLSLITNVLTHITKLKHF